MLKFLPPVWAAIAFQLIYNAFCAAYLGNFKSPVGDWLYARNCNYGFCDGHIFLAVMHGMFAVWLVALLLGWRPKLPPPRADRQARPWLYHK